MKFKTLGGCLVFLGLLSILGAAAVIFLPLVLIWCINTLGDLNNPYDLTHWFAALLLSGGLLGGSHLKVRAKKEQN